MIRGWHVRWAWRSGWGDGDYYICGPGHDTVVNPASDFGVCDELAFIDRDLRPDPNSYLVTRLFSFGGSIGFAFLCGNHGLRCSGQ